MKFKFTLFFYRLHTICVKKRNQTSYFRSYKTFQWNCVKLISCKDTTCHNTPNKKICQVSRTQKQIRLPTALYNIKMFWNCWNMSKLSVAEVLTYQVDISKIYADLLKVLPKKIINLTCYFRLNIEKCMWKTYDLKNNK